MKIIVGLFALLALAGSATGAYQSGRSAGEAEGFVKGREDGFMQGCQSAASTIFAQQGVQIPGEVLQRACSQLRDMDQGN